MVRNSVSSVVAAVVLMGAMAAPAGAQVEMDSVYSKETQQAAMEAVVRIRATKGAYISQGSGVCVAYNATNRTVVIVTAGHVVKGATQMSFEVFTAARYPNPVAKYTPQAKWWYDEKNDVGIIVARMWVPRMARLATNPAAIRKGDHVFSVGCGIGAPPVAQVGDISGIDPSGDYILKRGAVGGRSGGPLIGRQGVIGIVSRGRNGETLFVSLDKIHALIRQVAAHSSGNR